MSNWFGDTSEQGFHLFGVSHILFITIYILGFIIILLTTKRLTQKSTRIMRWTFLGILLFSEILYQTWGFVNESWNTREFLPFQLCSIAGIITMLALYTRNNKLIQIIFFISIVPSFLAVLTPELFHGFPHFRHWQFFIHHMVLSWSTIFLVVSNHIHINFKITINTYILLLLYAATVGFILNPLFNANFLFLARSSTADTPLQLLGTGMWYYINLCIVGFCVFMLLFVFYQLLKKIKLI